MYFAKNKIIIKIKRKTWEEAAAAIAAKEQRMSGKRELWTWK